MNIYLDIDGTILLDEKRAALGADEFLQAILAKYPNSTYWLTTHCWQGENRTLAVLRPALKLETLHILEKVKPTDWGEWKTEAIDFSQPFLWFDDDCFIEEVTALAKHNASNSYVPIDLFQNPLQLVELTQTYFV